MSDQELGRFISHLLFYFVYVLHLYNFQGITFILTIGLVAREQSGLLFFIYLLPKCCINSIISHDVMIKD